MKDIFPAYIIAYIIAAAVMVTLLVTCAGPSAYTSRPSSETLWNKLEENGAFQK